jgi:hypothetical protein
LHDIGGLVRPAKAEDIAAMMELRLSVRRNELIFGRAVPVPR